MPNYIIGYHGGGQAPTPEEGEKVMQAWMSWFEKIGPSVIDGGNPVGASKTIASSGAVSDGGGANPLTGYSVLKADNLDAAVALAKGCPILMNGGSVEVGETFNAM